MKHRVNPSNDDIPIRKIQVDLSQGFPKHWHGNDPYKTCLFNTYSLLFPAIEGQLVDVMRGWLHDLQAAGLTDLHADVKALIGQETTHRHLHQQYNEQLERQGYRNLIDRFIRWRINRLPRPGRLSELAIVIGTEQFMSILGDGVLRDPAWLDGADPEMAKIWRWHAAEENEHKAVSFDTYQAMGGGYFRRIFWYLGVSLTIFFDITWQTTHSQVRDRSLLSPRAWWSALRFWLWRPGVIKHLVPQWLRFFSPRFHPWQHDNRALILRWREQSSSYVQVMRSRRP